MHTIFNTVHAMSDMNNIYQFQDIGKYLLELDRAQTDRQTDKPNA